MSKSSSATPGSGAMFDRIAPRYDLMNRLISLGLDRRWRRRLVAAVTQDRPARVLDLATGTADVALELARALPRAQIVGLDPSPGMVTLGHQKVHAAHRDDRVQLALGDGQRLPFARDVFDASCIAFGIRNVPDRTAALRELVRVTRGPVAVLELAEPGGGALAPLARLHARRLVPRLGAWLSGAQEYRYLQRSVAAFPPAVEFAELMRESGLADVRFDRLTFGAAHLYVGVAGGNPTTV